MSAEDGKVIRDLADLFIRFTSSRIGRFLEVNPRTVQRWIKTTHGHIDAGALPEDLREKISKQAELVRSIGLFQALDDIREKAIEAGVHEEVLAAHFALQFERTTGKSIE
ncbi:hypothetical protein [Devosia salina]|uniref:Uncharacterized protein n=1 Tax=Devosia salina TaxID=2860336 RepID=A0ABX8WKQ4_9HYPH|nr:hypothetical protein [Devosia salina]QYO78354.1 hypothetical protein K1X15_07350 [Devosia salina]